MSRIQVLSTLCALTLAVCTAAADTVTTNFVGVNKIIPDGQTTGVADTRTIDFGLDNFSSITDLQVNLTITNGYNGDLYAYLVHDSGFAILLNRSGRTSGSSAGYSDAGMDITLNASGTDIHAYQTVSYTLNGAGQLTGTWSADGRYVNPTTVLDTDSRTTGLLGSFTGTDPNGTWTLFLADLDFGDQATLVNWGLTVTAIPEPSTYALLGLGGLVLVHHLRKKK